MKISTNSVVTLQFTLKDAQGNTVDDTSEGAFTYIHGLGGFIPAAEARLEGLEAGASVQFSLKPEEHFGERDESLVDTLSKDNFEEDVAVGEQFQTVDEEGNIVILTVAAVKGDEVTVDRNHPLAGLTLVFDIQVESVRAATAEELEHGHIHGEGCDHH
ncbi:MAG: hypothetical protein RL095_138 [Verrucomicrobiota bacterium]|jgi:FKBP-type peptidyl-prolyl cis-trans isomerase SlyD